MTKKMFVKNPLSPYALAGILSEVTGKDIRPQMVYGATRANDEGESKLQTTLSETGKQVVSPEDANEYIEGYLARQTAREEKAAAKAEEATAETN